MTEFGVVTDVGEGRVLGVGKGVCSGAKFFRSALLQPARSVCVSSERICHIYIYIIIIITFFWPTSTKPVGTKTLNI